MNEKCYQLLISGKVQGVFFRKFASIKARSLDIKGFVKNQSDGTVYIEACGELSNLEHFIQWCNQGPVNARVDQVKVNEITAKQISSFTIKYF